MKKKLTIKERANRYLKRLYGHDLVRSLGKTTLNVATIVYIGGYRAGLKQGRLEK